MSFPAKKSIENPMLDRQRLLMQMASTAVVGKKLQTGELEIQGGKITIGKNFNQSPKPQLSAEC